MTDTTAQEPTMEEILASIRRIISEDDTPAIEADSPAEATAPEPVAETPSIAAPEPAPAPVEDEEILDLTDRYEAPATESIGDLDITARHEEPEPFPTAFQTEPASYDRLVGESASASAASAFAGLAASFRPPEPTPTGGTGPTIDDLARALLRPMLKEWLDNHLPGIVERAVRSEIERVVSRGS
jgi:cell pole-organizing protein PopZ